MSRRNVVVLSAAFYPQKCRLSEFSVIVRCYCIYFTVLVIDRWNLFIFHRVKLISEKLGDFLLQVNAKIKSVLAPA